MYEIGNITGAYPVGKDQATPSRAGSKSQPARGVADTATFSPQAKDIATLSNLIADGDRNSQLRSERIEQAKEAIREGTYRVQDVVEQVARIITPYV